MKAQSGIVRLKVAFSIAATILLGFAGFALAQVVSNYEANDPCAVYPHASANIPNATPTQKLIAGAVGKQIYICAIHVQQVAGATPGLTLAYGEVAAATPCGTATPGGTLGVYGSVAAGSTSNIGTGYQTVVGPAPAAAGTPVVDVCSLTNTAAFVSGSVEYVQR